MLFAVDVGNTNTVLAVFRENSKLSEWRCTTDISRTADEYLIWLKNLMELSEIDFKSINSVIISSVVPQVVFNLRYFLILWFNLFASFSICENFKFPIYFILFASKNSRYFFVSLFEAKQMSNF